MSLSPNHDRIEDSLDNLNLNKLRQSSVQKNRSQVMQIKQKFVNFLQKLQFSETRQIGISQIGKLIDQYRESDFIRTYISIMKNLKPNSNSTTKEHEVLVISLLAQTLKTTLIDPVDKPPSLLKTCFRLVQILHGYFADISHTVQQACARALVDLNNFCLKGQSNENIISLIFLPLASILKSGVDKASQTTATVCLNELIIYWFKTNNLDILQKISKQMLLIMFKINSQYNDFFHALIVMIEVKGLTFFQSRLTHFLNKIIAIINATKQTNSSFNNYMCKVHVCKIIQKIALLLDAKEKQKMIDLNIIESLEKATRNRIIQVQMAAQRALKAWKGEQLERENSLENQKIKGLTSLEELRNNKKRQRSSSKEQINKMENQLTFIKEDLQKMVKGGWGASNRAKNYVKRGSGIGGGFHGKLQTSPQSQQNNKSHKEHIEELRQIIRKGAVQNKNVDKFHYVEERKQRSRSISPNPKRVNMKVQKKELTEDNKRRESNGSKDKEMDEFGQQIDQGQQMINVPSRQRQQRVNNFKSNPSSDKNPAINNNTKVRDNGNKITSNNNNNNNKMNQKSIQRGSPRQEDEDLVSLSKTEMNELLKHEESLMNDAKQMNINFHSQEEEHQNQHHENPQKKPFNLNFQEKNQPNYHRAQLQDNKKQNKQNKLTNVQVVGQHSLSFGEEQKNGYHQEKLQIERTEKKREGKQPKQLKKQTKIYEQFKPFSEEEIGELINSQNLSEVSDNLNDILTASDVELMQPENMELINSKILEQYNNGTQNNSKKKSEINALKDIIKENKQERQSRVTNSFNKFLKKQDSKVKNEPLINPMPITSKPREQMLLNSLNFTDSQRSDLQTSKQQKNKSNNTNNFNEREQFTLNPNNNLHNEVKVNANKFSSLQAEDVEYNLNGQKEIDEEIQMAMSCYEESVPKINSNPNNLKNKPQNSNINTKPQMSVLPLEAKQSRQRQYEPNLKKTVVEDEDANKTYQNIIRNPPKAIDKYADKRSNLHSKSIHPYPNNQSNQESQLSSNQNHKVSSEKHFDNSQAHSSYQVQEKYTISEQWIKILHLIEAGQLNDAFEIAFRLDDPIYLLRMLIITKTPLRKLTAENNIILWNQFLEIYSSQFLDLIFLQLMMDAQENNLIKGCLSLEEIQDLMLELFQISGTSKGKLSLNSACLYNKIEDSLKIKHKN